MNLNKSPFAKHVVPIIIYLFISFCLVFLSLVKALMPVYMLDDIATGSIRGSLFQVGQNAQLGITFILHATYIEKQNESLLHQSAELQSLRSQNLLLLIQNKSLRNQLGISQEKSSKLVMALITSQSPLLNFVTLNVGQKESVQVNDVVVYKNVLLGKVVAVTDTSARVELVTDIDSNVPIILPSTNVSGVVTGSLSSGLNINDILPAGTVNEGEDVITSGIGGYPPGLDIGSISSVQGISSQPFRSASVDPAISINSLMYVFIETI